MARPTEYSQDVVDQAQDYIDSGWREAGNKVPSIVGLCREINRSRSIVYDWAADSEKEFSDILEQIMELQYLQLVNNGLAGDFNSTITKLMLTKHGLSDRIDSTNNVTTLSHEDWLDSLDE